MDIEDAFWSRVDTSGECWLWTNAPITKEGYCGFWWEGRRYMAHRAALAISEGRALADLPEDLCALHSCDTPRCVRPSHLRWGTKKDNADDRTERGRHHDCSGSRNSRAVLTEAQVADIRERLLSGEQQATIARDYRVPRQTIWKIKHGRQWVGV